METPTIAANLAWYAWIPTNLGLLDFKLIGKIDNLSDQCDNYHKDDNSFWIENLNTKKISDTYTPIIENKFLKTLTDKLLPKFKGEVYSNASIHLRNGNNITGNIRLFYQEICEIRANIDIEYSGKCKIYQLEIINFTDKEFDTTDFSNQTDFLDYLAQVLFIIVKYIVHSDNHHHQKIDTAIKVESGTFKPILVVDSLIKHVKAIESDIKQIDHCKGRIKIENSIEEAKGYRSYIKTFRELFLSNNDLNIEDIPIHIKEPKILDNIIDSLEAHVKKSIINPDTGAAYSPTY